jgi:hypothetical protein
MQEYWQDSIVDQGFAARVGFLSNFFADLECDLLALGVSDAVLRARRTKTRQHNSDKVARKKHFLLQPHNERWDDSAVNNDPVPWRVLGNVIQEAEGTEMNIQ